MLQELYDNAENNNSDIVICDYYEVTDDKKVKKSALPNLAENYNSDYILANPSPWNKLIRTEILKINNIRFLEHHIYEDLATMPLLGMYATNITHLKKPLYNYIIRSGSTMRQTQYSAKIESIFTVMEYLEKNFKNSNNFEQYKQEIEFLNIEHLLYASYGRFLEYEEGKDKLVEIINIMKNKYPDWKKNKYYKKQSLKFKLTCNIFYHNTFVKLYSFLRKKIKKDY